MTTELDEALDRLTVTTEALLHAAQDLLAPSFCTLLDEREAQLELLKAIAGDTPLEAHHAERLERIQATGQEVRAPLAVQRALIRQRLDELRAAQQTRRALTPPHEAKGRRLSIRA